VALATFFGKTSWQPVDFVNRHERIENMINLLNSIPFPIKYYSTGKYEYRWNILSHPIIVRRCTLPDKAEAKDLSPCADEDAVRVMIHDDIERSS
jgi:hypothetical protein